MTLLGKLYHRWGSGEYGKIGGMAATAHGANIGGLGAGSV